MVLDAEIACYERNLDLLLRLAEGRFVLIHGGEVLGIFERAMEAVAEGYRLLGNVPFLVRQILPVQPVYSIMAADMEGC